MPCSGFGSDSHFKRSGKYEPGAFVSHAIYHLSGCTSSVHLLNELVAGMEDEFSESSAEILNYQSESAALDTFFT